MGEGDSPRRLHPLVPTRSVGTRDRPTFTPAASVLMMENIAPLGSSTTAKRPTEMSVGGTHTLPPCSLIFRTASTSATAM